MPIKLEEEWDEDEFEFDEEDFEIEDIGEIF